MRERERVTAFSVDSISISRYLLFFHVKQMIIYANVSSRSKEKRRKNAEKEKPLRVAQSVRGAQGSVGNPKLSFSLPCFCSLLSLSPSLSVVPFLLLLFAALFVLCADMLLSFILFISVRFAFYNKLLLCFIVRRPFAEPSDFSRSPSPSCTPSPALAFCKSQPRWPRTEGLYLAFLT